MTRTDLFLADLTADLKWRGPTPIEHLALAWALGDAGRAKWIRKKIRRAEREGHVIIDDGGVVRLP